MSRRSSNRVERGGSWNNNARNCRVSNRNNNNNPGNYNNNLGLRLALYNSQPYVLAVVNRPISRREVHDKSSANLAKREILVAISVSNNSPFTYE